MRRRREGSDGWRNAVLTVEQMGRADRLALSHAADSFSLMRAAGGAVARIGMERFPDAAGFDVLCGPGNNGGDGYVAARALLDAGRDVAVWAEAAPAGGDALRALEEAGLAPQPLSAFQPSPDRAVIDALFGAGLSRPLSGAAAQACRLVRASDAFVLAVDLPSGIAGDTGRPLGEAFAADVTVTFARKKPAHLLNPGRALCGEIVVADIGISDAVIAQVSPNLWENGPSLWGGAFPWPAADSHKYSRGHLAVCSGGPFSSGAARLAARAGARAGAGAVTLLSPPNALLVNAAHLDATMLHRVEDAADFRDFLDKRKCRAVVLGPGFGDLGQSREFAMAILRSEGPYQPALVLDADGITAFREDPASLFAATPASPAPRLVLTPHEGEFARLFPDLAAADSTSKVKRARAAAARANAAVILKGEDTVVAEPSGRTVINANATPFLATAGSGDVLAGICGGLLAQGMPMWEAACAAVWLHGEAGRRFGPGLTADDLPDALLPMLGDLHEKWRTGTSLVSSQAPG